MLPFHKANNQETKYHIFHHKIPRLSFLGPYSMVCLPRFRQACLDFAIALPNQNLLVLRLIRGLRIHYMALCHDAILVSVLRFLYVCDTLQKPKESKNTQIELITGRLRTYLSKGFPYPFFTKTSPTATAP